MNNIVYKKKADARWEPIGFGTYRCSYCKTFFAGNYHLQCPRCKSQMHKEGDLIYNEATGEVHIVKLGEPAL